MDQFIFFAYGNKKRLLRTCFPRNGRKISHWGHAEKTHKLKRKSLAKKYNLIWPWWFFLHTLELYLRPQPSSLFCQSHLTMLIVIGELVLLLLGTAITATLQFNSPKCDQLSSAQLSFVVEWWGIAPYLNNSTSSPSEHPNKFPPPTEGLVYVRYYNH